MDAYASLRAGYPQAHIAVLTTPPFAGLFAAMPWFDEVVIDHRAAVGNLRQMIDQSIEPVVRPRVKESIAMPEP